MSCPFHKIHGGTDPNCTWCMTSGVGYDKAKEAPWPFPTASSPCPPPEETPEEAYDRAMGPLRKG